MKYHKAVVHFHCALAAAFLASIAACGKDDGPAKTDAGPFVDDRPIELRGACPRESLVGKFRLVVSSVDDQGRSSIDGAILDRVDATLARELVADEGDCRLLRRLNPLCDPACTSEQTCSIQNTCVARARGIDVGPVRLGGLSTNIELEAQPPGNDYFNTELAHPAFGGDEEIRLRTTSGDLAVDGIGSEPLVVLGGEWAINQGQALEVTWEAPTLVAIHTRVSLSLSIDQHGTTPVNLACEFDDDGGASIPTAVIDQLFAAGVSGFANARLERQTSDSQNRDDGCVEFQVAHPRRHTASVAGHTPCNGPTECPEPQICDLGSNTCVDE